MLRNLAPTLALALAAALAGCGSPASGAPSAAAIVNGHSITYKAYHKQVLYKLYTAEQDYNNLNVCHTKGYGPICAQLKRAALGDLIAAELVREWAAKRGISVSKATFQQQWAQEYKARFHSNHLILVAWSRQLGLTPTDIKNLLRQNILDDDVMYHITRGLPSQTPAVHLSRILATTKSEIETIRKRLRLTPFSFLATQLNGTKGSGCSRFGCGDIGWVPKPLLPADQIPLLRAPVKSIRGPFPAQTGYVLFQVVAKNPHYQLTAEEQLGWRQAIFAHWIAEQKKHATIHRYAA